VKQYEFLGVWWNHVTSTVATSKRNQAKLPKMIGETITFQAAEQLIHRLIFASGVLCAPLAREYFTMKWFRRRLNDFSRGIIKLDSKLHLSPALKAALETWIKMSKRSYVVPAASSAKVTTIFFDASLTGWGAVCVSSAQQVHVVGDTWTQSWEPKHINELEAKAVVNGLTGLQDILGTSGDESLRLVVDNTSVQSIIRRGTALSEGLTLAALPVFDLLKSTKSAISIEYIKSADNPADSVSRGAKADPVLARWHADERNGGGRADFCRVLPRRNAP
jgi:hypothetical protein